MTECIATFERTRSELQNVAGAIDGTHIPIIAPREDAVDYFSCYQHDMIVQGVVDGTGKFIDAVAGFSGVKTRHPLTENNHQVNSAHL